MLVVCERLLTPWGRRRRDFLTVMCVERRKFTLWSCTGIKKGREEKRQGEQNIIQSEKDLDDKRKDTTSNQGDQQIQRPGETKEKLVAGKVNLCRRFFLF